MLTDIEAIQKIYESLNQNDIPAVVKFFDPQIVRVEWEGYPSAGTFRGLDEVRAHFISGRSTWEEGSCDPEQFITGWGSVIALVHVKVRLKNKTEWNEGRVADVWTFRNGKVIEFRSFFTAQEALTWVRAN